MAASASAKLLPKWTDPESTLGVVSKRRKKTPQEANRSQFEHNALQAHHDAKYKEAFKGATAECAEIAQGPNAGKHGFGVSHIVAKWNSKVLSSPNDRQLSKSSVSKAVMLGNSGKSPPKIGRPRTIPIQLTKSIAEHITVRQISGKGEASRQNIVATTTALVHGTKWQGKLNPEMMWRKTRQDHPGIINPVNAKDNDDRRVDWLNFNTVNEWTDAVKTFLIDIGMVKDEPGIIREFPEFRLYFNYCRTLTYCSCSQMAFNLKYLSFIQTTHGSF